MGFVVRFDPGNKVLRAAIDGVVTEERLAELTAAVRRLLQSQAPDAIIVDLSDVTSFQVSNEVVRFLARRRPLGEREIERVVVAPQDLIFGVTRMFQSHADGIGATVYVVRSLEEAYKYLGSEYRHQQSA